MFNSTSLKKGKAIDVSSPCEVEGVIHSTVRTPANTATTICADSFWRDDRPAEVCLVTLA